MTVGILEVLLLDAHGLNDGDLLGRMDPYVLVKYKNEEQKSSVAKGQGGTPVWNEKFKFRAEYPSGGGHYKVVLTIMDKDTFTADDCIGRASIHVKDLLASAVENGTAAELDPCKYRVTGATENYLGEIRVAVSFTLQR